MKSEFGRNLLRILVGVLVVVGIVTGALNATLGGFTPMMWFLLALIFVVIITCREVWMIRTLLEGKK